MSRRYLKPITVGQLEKYLSMIKDKNIIIQVGFGEHHQDAKFILNIGGKLVLHPSIYGLEDQCENIDNILSLNYESSSNKD